MIEKFNQEYQPEKAIWWYTCECFIYQLLNRALRLLESDIIVDMGFFIHDLHQQLKQLHLQQFSNYYGQPLTLYRGQALSNEDLKKLKKSREGLLAFNSFVSTSVSESAALEHLKKKSLPLNMVGILFVMTVDPMIQSAIFANIRGYSACKEENEVLFSMHTVFRVDAFVQLDKGKPLFKVFLTLTSDDDPELSYLADRMEKDLGNGTGWDECF